MQTENVGTQSVPAVEKVFSILELLAHSVAGLTLRELSEVSGFPKSSVHGILVTLQRSGYLYRSARTSRYLFSGKLLALAGEALNGLDLRDRAEPHMRALARQISLPVWLAILDNSEAVVIASMNYGCKAKSVCWVGRRMELHCTGLGKALIAWWSEGELRRLCGTKALPRHNDNTLSTYAQLVKELAHVRATGYSTDDEEEALGVRSVGAPIFDPQNKVIAAFGVTGSIDEITPDNVLAIAAGIKAAASECTRCLA
jgi:DNA-binding IclR family transcriptional regulator